MNMLGFVKTEESSPGIFKLGEQGRFLKYQVSYITQRSQTHHRGKWSSITLLRSLALVEDGSKGADLESDFGFV